MCNNVDGNSVLNVVVISSVMNMTYYKLFDFVDVRPGGIVDLDGIALVVVGLTHLE